MESMVSNVLEQWFSARGDSATRGHQVMSGDICGCHEWGDPGIEWVGAREAAPHPTEPTTVPQRMSRPHVSSAGATLG